MILENIKLDDVQVIVEKLNHLKNKKNECDGNLNDLNIKMKEIVNNYYKINQIIIVKQKECLKEYN